jgi:hypothetical protein
VDLLQLVFIDVEMEHWKLFFRIQIISDQVRDQFVFAATGPAGDRVQLLRYVVWQLNRSHRRYCSFTLSIDPRDGEAKAYKKM